MIPAGGAGNGGAGGQRRRPTREQRLEEELRANLKRRKDQARSRTGKDDAAAGDAGQDRDGEPT